MEKLKMQSPDLTQKNIEAIEKLFPNVITEVRDETGKLRKAVDFDLLRQELSSVIIEGDKERYQLTWPGKKEAMLLANAKINKTLRPVKEDSVDWDNTQNLYIEGDNLEALKLLQEAYLGKIKCIYIDPPYNTGNDYIYRDDFTQEKDGYLEGTGQVDEDGNRLFRNTESNGRFHSDWLSMMYSRLKIARNLLKDDGMIFISIDENEIENLKKLCNEVFGKSNSVGTFIWRKKDGGGQTREAFVIEHEYIVVYRKSDNTTWIDKSVKRDKSEYNKSDDRGIYKIIKLAKWGNTARREDRPSMYFPLKAPNGTLVFPVAPDGNEGRWRIGKEKMNELIRLDLIHWEKKDGKWVPYEKEYFDNQEKVIKERSILYDIANTGDGSNVLTEIFGRKDIFENPKPVELVKLLLSYNTVSNDIILDFFSGSATTAHAVMQLNAEDGGNRNRKYIMVQLPEPTSEDSEAYKAGYRNICELGKERIRRAAKKIKEETNADIDYGFRVFRVDSSNMKDVYYRPSKLDQGKLVQLESNIKEDRTAEDLLIQVILDCGLELSLPMETREFEGKKVFFVAGNSLVACFDEDVPEHVIKEIAKEQPLRVVFRDRSFSDDADRINVEEIFKMLSPTTEIKVL